MSKKRLPLNLLMMRGGIGKNFVIKHTPWGIIKTKFPDMSRIIASAEQRKCRKIFAEAVKYAQSIIADPILKAEWQRKIRRRNGVYNKAIKAFMLKENCAKIREQLLLSYRMRVAMKNDGLIKDRRTRRFILIPTGRNVYNSFNFLETG